MPESNRGRQHPGELIEPPPCDLLSLELPAGQTSSERIAALLDAAGFRLPEPSAPVEMCGFTVNVDDVPVFICSTPPHPETPHQHGTWDGRGWYDEYAEKLRRGTHYDGRQ